MLAWTRVEGRGAADRLMAEVAGQLLTEGWPLAGAVQVNLDAGPGRRARMELHVLATDRVLRISQDLGLGSRGCRLDTGGLEDAAGLAEASLELGPRLVIVNKFGKQEADGRGFRPLIGRALTMGLPVLTSVSAANITEFERFADGMATRLPPRRPAILNWARQTASEIVGAAPVS